MSYLSRKDDALKLQAESNDSKPIPRFSTQLTDNRKTSTDAMSNMDNSLPRYNSSLESKNKLGSRKVDIQNFKIGYGSLTEQMCKRAFRKGSEFNLMVVGGCGLGKSTFVNTMLLSDFYNADHLGPSKRIKKTVYVEPTTVVLKERDVVLKLCLIDTPGFGDAVDNSACWDPVLEYLDTKNNEFMEQEGRVIRSGVQDKRVHACLYFIQPTGHSLKPLDIEFLKRIHEKVNVIPVIAKADSLTIEECRDFKKNISNQLTFHKIRTYDFPETGASFHPGGGTSEGEMCAGGDNLDVKKCRDRLPFAVVGSNVMIDKAGKKVRGRRYPWGDVEVENMEHNDFIYLRHLLMTTHLQDLKDVTAQTLYERYRSSKLARIAEQCNFQVGPDGKDPMSQLEAEKLDQETRIGKMEEEMRQLFIQKAEERATKLRESETEMEKRQEMMRGQLETQTTEFEQQKQRFEAEKLAWEEAHRDWDLDFDMRSSSERLENKTKSKRKTLF